MPQHLYDRRRRCPCLVPWFCIDIPMKWIKSIMHRVGPTWPPWPTLYHPLVPVTIPQPHPFPGLENYKSFRWISSGSHPFFGQWAWNLSIDWWNVLGPFRQPRLHSLTRWISIGRIYNFLALDTNHHRGAALLMGGLTDGNYGWERPHFALHFIDSMIWKLRPQHRWWWRWWWHKRRPRNKNIEKIKITEWR